MVKKLITEISEEDFRKLDLRVYKTERIDIDHGHKFAMVQVSLNDILDKEIEYALRSGYESDYKDFLIPVTIAIHEPYTEEDFKKVRETFKGLNESECIDYCLRASSYLDKFMNQYSGSQTYQIGWGIKHLYSTRDYYEDHEDYWRVRKSETKVIYRVKLSDIWLSKFVLKHKTECVYWPYNELPGDVSPDYYDAKLCISYDLQDDGTWKESYRYGVFKYEHSEHHVPVDKDGKEMKPVWKM